MYPQLLSHNQRGQENLEPVSIRWFYSGKGLIFSHVRGKQNGKQMGNLGKCCMYAGENNWAWKLK